MDTDRDFERIRIEFGGFDEWILPAISRRRFRAEAQDVSDRSQQVDG